MSGKKTAGGKAAGGAQTKPPATKKAPTSPPASKAAPEVKPAAGAKAPKAPKKVN
ncbi:hypothetical protein D9619_010960 [Psilocybe cf. subviscida]|uniref:Uncharacterized protein n=1 Tax=Psilocybe cf. subviscida TaxID=2480587 RepID=A0A8H5EZZ4_9AGAR|nr:hypothetical protein D9619_010960 [Psilocybe cf. subviscida]